MLPGESLVFPVVFEFVLAVLGNGAYLPGSPCLPSKLPARATCHRHLQRARHRLLVRLHHRAAAALPRTAALAPADFLGITFTSALSIGLRPMLSSTQTWLVWVADRCQHLDDTHPARHSRRLAGLLAREQHHGHRAAVTVANLYIQGGMRVEARGAGFALGPRRLRRHLHLEVAGHQPARATLPRVAAWTPRSASDWESVNAASGSVTCSSTRCSSSPSTRRTGQPR